MRLVKYWYSCAFIAMSIWVSVLSYVGDMSNNVLNCASDTCSVIRK